jgi:sulfate adenylyltransferase
MSATSDLDAGPVPVSPTAAPPPELLADAARVAELAAASLTWPSLTIDAGTLADVEMMLLGLYGPAPGFAEPTSDGCAPGSSPRLGVDPSAAEGLSAGDQVALRDAEGVMVATLRVTAKAADGGGSGRVCLVGPVEGIRLPHHPDYPELRLTTRQVRAELARRGWSAGGPDVTPRGKMPVGDLGEITLCAPSDTPPPGRAAAHVAIGAAWALWADGLLHTADLDRIRSLRAQGRNVVVLAPVGGTHPADATHHLRIRCLRAALCDLAAGGGGEVDGPDVPLVLVPVQPAAPVALADIDMRAWRTRLAGAYGLAGSLLGPAPGSPNPSALTEALDAGKPLPAELTPSTVAAELASAHPPRHRRGLTVLFTGLSGSGKSTLANLLTCRLLERGDRAVTLLDGDVVRHHLSAGLGFSRADRDTNIRRIGFVAAQVAGAGGTVVCAPIAPYASVRAEVRGMVEGRGAGFVLVHVSTPLEVCERRDRKGLYAKARAGLLGSFTGVSDPYEEPADAEVVVDTSALSPDAAVEKILHHLRSAGWLAW